MNGKRYFLGASGFVGGFFIGSNVIVMWRGAGDQV